MRCNVNSLLTVLTMEKEKNWNSEWTMKRFNENSYIFLVIVSYFEDGFFSFRNSPGLINLNFLAHTHSLKLFVLGSLSTTLLPLLLWNHLISVAQLDLTIPPGNFDCSLELTPLISYHDTGFVHLLLAWFPLIYLLRAFPPPPNLNQKQYKSKKQQLQTKPTRIVGLKTDGFL